MWGGMTLHSVVPVLQNQRPSLTVTFQKKSTWKTQDAAHSLTVARTNKKHGVAHLKWKSWEIVRDSRHSLHLKKVHSLRCLAVVLFCSVGKAVLQQLSYGQSFVAVHHTQNMYSLTSCWRNSFFFSHLPFKLESQRTTLQTKLHSQSHLSMCNDSKHLNKMSGSYHWCGAAHALDRWKLVFLLVLADKKFAVVDVIVSRKSCAVVGFHQRVLYKP